MGNEFERSKPSSFEDWKGGDRGWGSFREEIGLRKLVDAIDGDWRE